MGADTLQLGIRVYDPAEKLDPLKSVSFVTVDFPREDAGMPQADFIAKYIAPNLAKLTNLPLEVAPAPALQSPLDST